MLVFSDKTFSVVLMLLPKLIPQDTQRLSLSHILNILRVRMLHRGVSSLMVCSGCYYLPLHLPFYRTSRRPTSSRVFGDYQLYRRSDQSCCLSLSFLPFQYRRRRIEHQLLRSRQPNPVRVGCFWAKSHSSPRNLHSSLT